MRKNIKPHIAFLVAVFTVLAGCVKDKGNYDLQNIAGYTAGGFTATVNGKPAAVSNTNRIRVDANDHVKISIKTDLTNNFEPVYSWLIFEIDPLLKAGTLPPPAAEIATTKDFDQPFSKGPGKYQLFRKTTNRKNGTAYYDTFIIEVTAVNGLLVYHKNTQGTGDYSVIRTTEMDLDLPADKMGISKNIYSGINGGKTIAKPNYLWLREINDANFPNLVLAGSADGITQINYKTNVFEHSNYGALFGFPLESSPAPQGHMNGSNKTEYLVQHGEVYSINYMSASTNPKFTQLSDPGMSYSPHMMTIPTIMQPFRLYTNVLFNQTLQRFEYEEFGMLRTFMSVPGPMGALDVDPSATQMDLLYMGKGQDNTIQAVMKTGQGTLRYLVFDITDPYAVVCRQNLDLSAFPSISGSALWAIAERGPIAFYSRNNTVYSLNYETGTTAVAVNNIPAGATIKTVKLLKDRQNPVYDNAILFIGYNQGSTGSLLQVEFSPTSGIVKPGSQKTFTGMDEILDIVIKK